MFKIQTISLLILFLSSSVFAATLEENGTDSFVCEPGETLLVGRGHSPLRCRQGGAAEAEDRAMDDLYDNAYCQFAANCDGQATIRTNLASDGNWHYGIVGCNAEQYGCAKCTPRGALNPPAVAIPQE